MRKFTIATAAAVLALASTGLAFGAGNSANAPGHDRVCLITFTKAGTENNTDVTSAKVLPRKAAQAQASDTKRIYEYGLNGSQTQEACDCLNNPSTRAACDQSQT